MKKLNFMEASVKKEAYELEIRKVLVALSGGPDSVTTAHILKQTNMEILALHCNFHLRGEESNRDEKFVKEFCKEQGIELEIIDFNIPEYIKSHKGESVEMACRTLRHDWFRKKLEQTEFDRIVTGHNADDNIETFLLNMLRGSGTRGLKGMESDNGIIWRPLIKFHRSEILEYLKEKKLDFVTDSTNLESDYRRNFLRNRVIPLILNEWKGFEVSMDKTISNIQYENKIVEQALSSALPLGNAPLSALKIEEFPAPLLLIKRYIEPLKPFVSTPEEVLKAIKAKKPHIRKWRLKNGELILRNGNLFIKMSHGESCS